MWMMQLRSTTLPLHGSCWKPSDKLTPAFSPGKQILLPSGLGVPLLQLLAALVAEVEEVDQPCLRVQHLRLQASVAEMLLLLPRQL